MIHELLAKLGLTDKEITIYLALLEKGKATPAILTKVTDIQRSTIYSTAETLIQKGLITIDKASKNGMVYMALAPEELGESIERKKRELDKQKAIVHEAVELLRKIPKTSEGNVPKMRYVDSLELENYLFKNTEKWFASGARHDNTWWGFQDVSLIENFPKWVEYHWKIAPHKLQTRLLTNSDELKTPIAKKSLEKRQIKYIKHHNFTATIAVIGDYVLMAYTNKKPNYMIEIFDSLLAHNLRESFKLMWETSK